MWPINEHGFKLKFVIRLSMTQFNYKIYRKPHRNVDDHTGSLFFLSASFIGYNTKTKHQIYFHIKHLSKMNVTDTLSVNYYFLRPHTHTLSTLIIDPLICSTSTHN